ncbi:MAG: PcfK-like family protein [Prevotellaceae bacterium]|nr:PcfK-like family protein [Prevotellaceae bacterium]MDY3366429.1 PcfK-like family protein [Prevotella sp.]
MKGTEIFTRAIAEYLNVRAMTDPLFAPNLMKPNKNIDECITYILTEVQRMGCAGLSDEEVYSLAVHYYDEDNLKVGKPINCKVVVNHTIELTEEEKAEARKKAIERYQAEEYRKLTAKKPKVEKRVEQQIVQPSLFEF